MDAAPEFHRRVSAAIADAEERRGNLVAARTAVAEAMDDEPNEALLRYFLHTDARLATLLLENDVPGNVPEAQQR